MATAASVDDCMSCPVCLETLRPPITQCERGHSVCGDCVKGKAIKQCPLCRARMTSTRNYQLEELIVKLKRMALKVPCAFAVRGCKYELNEEEVDSHQLSCKKRLYKCEGTNFKVWNCDWTGDYADILAHFKSAHERNSRFEFNSVFRMKVNLQRDNLDIQAIDFMEGQQLFWFKYRTDTKKEKAYWLFQYVGSKTQAEHYYYELEISEGPIRKMKFTEICASDCEDADAIFDSERCVALSFETLRNYLNANGMIVLRFRIMKMKKEAVCASAPSVERTKNGYETRKSKKTYGRRPR